MLFFSFEFLAFFVAVFLVYWTVGHRSATVQNVVLLLAGMFFYGCADLRFLALLAFSAGANYGLGIAVEQARSEASRRVWFWSGIALNIGLLGYFKYFEFFYNSFADLLGLFGKGPGHLALGIALPLGISFFTFQMMGYLIDVFNGAIPSCRKPLAFFTYVFHFPKLLAGPVEPAQQFLPRVDVPRTFDPAMASDAMRQILWGVFAKVVIADNCARLVDPLFMEDTTWRGSTLFVGAMLYLLQLYGDFSGYSNMAIGFSRLLGIPLMTNFRAPLFATSISEFWRKWHVSLTTWMMERVFTPLSFLLRAHGRVGLGLSIFITFMAVGIWHGANWTFILFGALQGLFFLPLVIGGSVNRAAPGGAGLMGGLKRAGAMVGMFVLMSMTFVLMRAPDLETALHYWSGMISPSFFTEPRLEMHAMPYLLGFFLVLEWVGKGHEHVLAVIGRTWPLPVRWAGLSFIVFLVGMYMTTDESAFIYFQF